MESPPETRGNLGGCVFGFRRGGWRFGLIHCAIPPRRDSAFSSCDWVGVIGLEPQRDDVEENASLLRTIELLSTEFSIYPLRFLLDTARPPRAKPRRASEPGSGMVATVLLLLTAKPANSPCVL